MSGAPLHLDLRRALANAALVSLLPAALALVVVTNAGTPARMVAVTVGAGVCAWLFFSERYERTLLVLMLYLGLLDGYLRLRTGTSSLTLVRDVMIAAIAGGALARLVVRRQPVRLPPLAGLVLLFVAVVLVQVFNPNDGSIGHSFGGVRQHLEFVPLFFLGYIVVRSRHRLRVFLALLVLIGAVNGAVGFVQFGLTQEQLSSWGPGYRERITGTGDVSGRGFVDSRGNKRTRPFGLGSDMGAGGMFGVMGLAAGLALAALALRRRIGIAAVPLLGGVVLAIVTSQARTVIIAAGLTLVAFVLLGITSRRRWATLGALFAVVAVSGVVISGLASTAGIGAFDRYRSITPDKVLTTSFDYRRDDIGVLPDYLTEHPLGAGLGVAGPAASVGGKPAATGTVNAESQLNFLVLELGIPGLLVFLALTLSTLWLCVTRCRRIEDHETRLLLAAVAAPLFAILAVWLSGITSTSVPVAPYFWFATGVLAYWFGTVTSRANRAAAVSTP